MTTADREMMELYENDLAENQTRIDDLEAENAKARKGIANILLQGMFPGVQWGPEWVSVFNANNKKLYDFEITEVVIRVTEDNHWGISHIEGHAHYANPAADNPKRIQRIYPWEFKTRRFLKPLLKEEVAA